MHELVVNIVPQQTVGGPDRLQLRLDGENTAEHRNNKQHHHGVHRHRSSRQIRLLRSQEHRVAGNKRFYNLYKFVCVNKHIFEFLSYDFF